MGETLLESILKKYLKKRKITMVCFYSKPLPFESFVKIFENFNIMEWKEKMINKGITGLYSYIINIEPSDKFEIIKTIIPDDDRKNFPDGWKNWKERFSHWILCGKVVDGE